VAAADPNRLPEGAPAAPHGTGCFVWLPSGCMGSRAEGKSHWKRDVWGEEKLGTGESAEACSARKGAFNGRCGVRDAAMLYVGLQAASPEDASGKDGTTWPAGVPADPGTSVEDEAYEQFQFDRHRTGSARDNEHADPKVEKPTAEAAADSLLMGPSSEVPRHAESNAEGSPTMHSEQGLVVPSVAIHSLASKVPELPKAAGCYVWLPSGCLRNELDAKHRWRRDFWGEANRNAKDDASACKNRKDAYNDWCGVSDALMARRRR